jgi:RpiB/LacA/LacB family sugar-phosphate isomerase
VKIIVASDHVGFCLKGVVLGYLESLGVIVTDAGTANPEIPVDYPDFALDVARAVAGKQFDRGVLICGSGIGMSIAANRIPGVRAALCHDVAQSGLSRAHNDANILCLGANVVEPDAAQMILSNWLETKFEGGRHRQRLAKLETIDKEISLTSMDRRDLAPITDKFSQYKFGIAVSPRRSSFGPLLFSGRLEEGIEAACQAGLQAIEISLRSSGDVGINYLHEILERYGLSLAAIATGQACADAGLCLSASEEKIVHETVEHLQAIISFAADFGAPVIIGGIRGKLTGTRTDQNIQRGIAVEAIRECAAYSAKHGVALLIEPINRYETNFVNSSFDGLELLEEIGMPNTKLLLDTFHMNIEEVNIFEAFQNVGDYLGYVHLADSNRLAPGQGHIDFTKVFQALSSVVYQGYISAAI